jgi:hypothetical protein
MAFYGVRFIEFIASCCLYCEIDVTKVFDD